MISIKEKDFKGFETRKRARFINSLSGFKSANLVGTVNSQAQTNLSIVSSSFHLGADPALIGIIIRPDRSPRHTLDNIRDNQLCTLNQVSSIFFQQAHQTSARYPQETSEFKACGLTEEYLDSFKAPFVKESYIKMALKLEEEKKLEINGTHLLIMSIQSVYLPENCLLEDGFIDIERAGTACISGLDSYHTTTQLGRLPYAKV
jgi:flavin reductase (DIM6/NTAB) family NADH-FMN oxidoreductase RutF